jgi:hypothetical protein
VIYGVCCGLSRVCVGKKSVAAKRRDKENVRGLGDVTVQRTLGFLRKTTGISNPNLVTLEN